MDEFDAGDWKTRLKAYENIVQLMVNPTNELLSQLQSQLPVYLSDVNPQCQRTALTMCDLYFKNSNNTNNIQICHALIDKCLGARQQNADASIPLVLHCMKQNREQVTEMLFSKILNQSPKHILSVISIIVAHLATLTPKDSNEALAIITHLKPLLNHKENKIQKECSAAIASAKIVSGTDLDTTDTTNLSQPSPMKDMGSPSKNMFAGENSWPTLIASENWKDRKQGYELLLSCINSDFPINQYENVLITAFEDEKHVACNEVTLQIIEKVSRTFKTQLQRRVRDYITPIINMMNQKRQTRLVNVYSAFDAVAECLSPSPFEQPFVEYLLKMMTSQSGRLREEAANFIIRCNATPISPVVQETLLKMTEDPSASVRDLASKALSKIGNLPNPNDIKIPEPQIMKARQRAKSPETRKSMKRKPQTQTAISIWNDWASQEIITQLTSSMWFQVTKGLEQLKKHYDEDPNCPHAIVAGLSSIFIGKTFTPKVMGSILSSVHFYINVDHSKMGDDVLTSVLHFVLDKISDKRYESQLFEIMDSITECSSGQYVFMAFYPHLLVKNPVIPARIVSYFVHYITTLAEPSSLSVDELAIQMKPMFSHSDQTVRKAAHDCLSAISAVFGEDGTEHFRYVYKLHHVESKKVITESNPTGSPNSDLEKVVHLNEVPSEIIESPMPAQKSKPKSEIPVPKRSFSPKRNSRPVQQSPDPKKHEDKPIIPGTTIQAISKTSSILEFKKGLEEIETILNKLIESSTMIPYAEISELLLRLRQWFKDSNSNIVLSASKVVGLAVKVLNIDDFAFIPNDFLSDYFLLLNFSNKPIRASCLSTVSYITTVSFSFIIEVLVPSFSKLNTDGKIVAARFLREISFDMDVPHYVQFVITSLANKSEEFREAIRPLVERFLSLPGAIEELEKAADQFPPAKKSSVLTVLSSYIKPQLDDVVSSNAVVNKKGKARESYFSHPPSISEKMDRESSIDPFLPLKILNNEEIPESLGELLQRYSDMYFPSSITSTETDIIVSSCRFFLEIANNEFESFSLVIDIVFLWWANQALLIKFQEGFTEIIKFLETVLSLLLDKDRALSRFEFSIILPTVLECVGRDAKLWKKIQDLLFKACDSSQLLSVLVSLLNMTSSVFTIAATFRSLLEIMPKFDSQQYLNDLRNSTLKILSLVSNDPENNKELYDIATQFSEYIKHVTPSDVSKQVNKSNINRPSLCQLNSLVLTRINDCSLSIYTWISDIMSSDSHIVIQSLKLISAQMKKDESVFRPHIDALIVSLLIKVHENFALQPLPTRLCKYISFCLLTLFSETSLKTLIQKEYIQQLVYEMLTHLSNGITESVINQVLNAIIVKLIEDCPLHSFIALLSALGEFEGNSGFSEKWLRLAIKCFEACGARICEVGNHSDISSTFGLIDQFFEMHQISILEKDPIGQKVYSVLQAFLNLVMQNFGEIIRSKDNIKKLGSGSIVLGIVGVDSTVKSSPSGLKLLKPLRQ